MKDSVLGSWFVSQLVTCFNIRWTTFCSNFIAVF